MITIKSPGEIETMAAAGRLVAQTLALVARQARPGVSTEQLDRAAEDFIRSHPGARPSFKGLYDFPATLCTSINQEVVHGIPSPRRVLKEGDVLSVDVGVWLDGLHADSAATFPVGKVSPEAERLLAVTQEALAAGVAQARAGNHVGDIGHAVHNTALGEVGDERRSVALVHLEPGLDGLRRVVGPAFLRRPAGHPAHQLFLGHVQQQDVVQALAALPQGPIHELGLGGGAGEAVEHRALLPVGLRELFLDQGENDGIGDELPFVHELLGLATERRTGRDRGTEDVARRDLRQPEPLREDLALCALPRARRA